MRFVEKMPMRAKPVRATEYEPLALQKGQVIYAGYRPDLEANVYWVRSEDGMAPYPLGKLLAKAPELRDLLRDLADSAYNCGQSTAPEYFHRLRELEADARALLKELDQ